MADRSNWFEDFFHGIANDLWRKAVTAEQTRAEADFLQRTLGKKRRLLDVPCGNGRHSLELARRGCHMTGPRRSYGSRAGPVPVNAAHCRRAHRAVAVFCRAFVAGSRLRPGFARR